MIRYSGSCDTFDTNITCFKLLLEIDGGERRIELIRFGATSVQSSRQGAYNNKNKTSKLATRSTIGGKLFRVTRPCRRQLERQSPFRKLAASKRDRGLACGKVNFGSRRVSQDFARTTGIPVVAKVKSHAQPAQIT